MFGFTFCKWSQLVQAVGMLRRALNIARHRSICFLSFLCTVCFRLVLITTDTGLPCSLALTMLRIFLARALHPIESRFKGNEGIWWLVHVLVLVQMELCYSTSLGQGFVDGRNILSQRMYTTVWYNDVSTCSTCLIHVANAANTIHVVHVWYM